MGMLKVRGLRVVVDGRSVLRGVDIEIPEGEIHALLGPNASGKTSLAQTLLGFPNFKVVSGSIFFKGKDITRAPLDERVRMGLAIAFQNPPVVRGVKLRDVLKLIGKKTERDKLAQLISEMRISGELLNRDLNYGFSGGEKKKCEILQVLALNPDFVILDEPDSVSYTHLTLPTKRIV